jgi:hypothetical protein
VLYYYQTRAVEGRGECGILIALTADQWYKESSKTNLGMLYIF